ncbi:MAG TPA: hypothetical protein VEW04_06515, partial [Allosphingosinicella sp.]|nr:hypothetical protein [Allosphingosinicella sp.]
MDARRLKLALLIGPLLLALAIGGLIALLLRPAASVPGPDAEAIANAALLSIRDEGRTTVFVGRFVAVVTASETRLGLTARKTLIM